MARVEAEPTVCIADTTAGKELLIMIQTAEDPITFSPGGLWYVRVELFLAATLLSTAHSQGVIHFNCFTYDTLSSAGYKTRPHPSLVSSHPHHVTFRLRKRVDWQVQRHVSFQYLFCGGVCQYVLMHVYPVPKYIYVCRPTHFSGSRKAYFLIFILCRSSRVRRIFKKKMKT